MNDLPSKNSIELIINGKTFIDKNVELINKAKNFIILQTYIFEVDSTTQPVVQALKKKAQEGLDIYLLLDGFGSGHFPEKTADEFRKIGIHYQQFSPLFSRNFEHIGRRLHSKLLIIDDTDAMVGGINLSKRFNDPKNSPPWLDFSCHLKGDEVKNLIRKNLSLYTKYFPHFLQTHFYQIPQTSLSSKSLVKTKINDWMRIKNEIFTSYIKALRNAKNQIVIVAPYFFPGKKFLNELAQASKRGVSVDLIFSAVSDHPMERWSSKHLYSWFLSKKINIYEWGDSVVHGKIAMVDNHWVTIGSYNHNFLSRFSNHEVNLEVMDKDFVQVVRIEIQCIKDKSNLITEKKWASQNKTFDKLLETLSYIFANFLTVISMIVVIRRKDKSDFNLLE